MKDTFISRIYGQFAGYAPSIGWRLVVIAVLALLALLLVKFVRHVAQWLIRRGRAEHSPLGVVTHRPKFNTLIQLTANTVTFLTYFVALGLVLEEFGVNLTAYLASASIIGLAISFGSQALVQDMVVGLTLIFSDVMDAGDMVEIAGTTTVIGRVREIGLRFTKLVNFYNQIICIPNRTISNVSRFPHGGVDACPHIQIPPGADKEKVMVNIVAVAKGMWQQFGTVILSEPVIGTVEVTADGGWEYVCVLFRIWPSQGTLIETTFRQQMIKVLKAFQPDYSDWQIPVTYRSQST
jgi:small conductance mechanosensitive channel